MVRVFEGRGRHAVLNPRLDALSHVPVKETGRERVTGPDSVKGLDPVTFPDGQSTIMRGDAMRSVGHDHDLGREFRFEHSTDVARAAAALEQ